MNLENISKYMCLILRHKPDLGKITFNGNSKLESYYEVNGLLLC